MAPKLTKQEQNRQIKREALICVVVYIGFFLWWFITGYGFGTKEPSEYMYIMGLPLWFVLSVLVGTILFFVVMIIVVKRFFKDFDFEETGEEEEK